MRKVKYNLRAILIEDRDEDLAQLKDRAVRMKQRMQLGYYDGFKVGPGLDWMHLRDYHIDQWTDMIDEFDREGEGKIGDLLNASNKNFKDMMQSHIWGHAGEDAPTHLPPEAAEGTDFYNPEFVAALKKLAWKKKDPDLYSSDLDIN